MDLGDRAADTRKRKGAAGIRNQTKTKLELAETEMKPIDGAGTPGYPKPWLSEKILGHRFFRNIVLS